MRETITQRLLLIMALAAVVLAAMPFSAQGQCDDLQQLLDGLAKSTVTRANGDGFTDIDISSIYATDRSKTVEVRGGVKVRFINGTISQSADLTDGPLVRITEKSEVILASSASFAGGNGIASYPIVELNDAKFTVDGGNLINTWVNPFPQIKMIIPAVKITSASGAEFRMTGGKIEGWVGTTVAGSTNTIVISGGSCGYVTTNHSFLLSGSADITEAYFREAGAHVLLTSQMKNNLMFNGGGTATLKNDMLVLEGTGYQVTADDLGYMTLPKTMDESVLSLEGNQVYIRAKAASGPIRTLNNVVAGTLGTLIPEADRPTVEELTITGYLNDEDVKVIRQMGKAKLTKLDISGVQMQVSNYASAYNTDDIPYEEMKVEIRPIEYIDPEPYDPDAIKYYNIIGPWMFADMKLLITVALPETATEIGEGAFSGCSSLQQLTVGKGMTKISGNRTFRGCDMLDNLQIASSLFTVDGGIIYNAQKTTVYAVLPNNLLGSPVLPETVDSIAPYAFYGIYRGAVLSLPKSLKKVGDYAFCNNGAKYLNIPEGVQQIGTGSFYRMSNLYTLELPSTIDSIGPGAFAYCGLETIDMRKTKIRYLPGNNSSPSIPNNSYSFGVFEGDSAVQKVYLPATLQGIGRNVFTSPQMADIYCYAQKPPQSYGVKKVPREGEASDEIIAIDGGQRYLYSFSLANAGKCSVHVNNGVIDDYKTSEGWKNFYNIIGIYSPQQYANLTSLEEQIAALIDRSWLLDKNVQTLYLDNLITENEKEVFIKEINGVQYELSRCKTELEDLYYSKLYGDNLSNAIDELQNHVTAASAELAKIEKEISAAGKLNAGSVFTAQTVEGVTMTFVVISAEEMTCQVGLGGQPAIDTNTAGIVTIPAEANGYTVLKIANRAFMECMALTQVIIPNTVTEIGTTDFQSAMGPFHLCTGLETLEIPSSVTLIGRGAIGHCRKLTTLKIPESVTVIGSNAFDGCSGLVSIELSPNISAIELETFRNCSALESIVIPAGVKSIGSSAFQNCSSLKTVTSLIAEPFRLADGVFTSYDATLIVPEGSLEKYKSTPAWNKFFKITTSAGGEDEADDLQDLLNKLAEQGKTGTEEAPANIDIPGDKLDVNGDVAFDDLQALLDGLAGKQQTGGQQQELPTVKMNPGSRIIINPGSSLTLRNLILEGSLGTEYIYVYGTLIIDVNVTIRNYVRYIYVCKGGRVIWRNADANVANEVIYNDGGTVEYGGGTSQGAYGFVVRTGGIIHIYGGTITGTTLGGLVGEGGTVYIYKDAVVNGGIESAGTVYLSGDVDVKDIYVRRTGTIYVTERITKVWNIHFTDVSDIDVYRIYLSGWGGYTLTEEDVRQLNIILPEGYTWVYRNGVIVIVRIVYNVETIVEYTGYFSTLGTPTEPWRMAYDVKTVTVERDWHVTKDIHLLFDEGLISLTGGDIYIDGGASLWLRNVRLTGSGRHIYVAGTLWLGGDIDLTLLGQFIHVLKGGSIRFISEPQYVVNIVVDEQTIETAWTIVCDIEEAWLDRIVLVLPDGYTWHYDAALRAIVITQSDGIIDVTMDADQAAPAYNLQGRRIANNPYQKTKKGQMFIKNGKKYMNR